MSAGMYLLTNIRLLGIEVSLTDESKIKLKSPGGVDPAVQAEVIANKPALLEALVLENRLRAMASRWHYTAEELAEVLVLAAADPVAWTLAVALDERREAEFKVGGILVDA